MIRIALLLMLLLAACGAAPPRVVVEWTTATEINTAGFNLYRSTYPEGPFVKINSHLLPASTDPLAGGKYKYEDSHVTAGQTYYYKLEDVELGGAKQEHGPIKITAGSDRSNDYVVVLGVGLWIATVSVLIATARKRSGKTAS